jgi:hypothetical protein
MRRANNVALVAVEDVQRMNVLRNLLPSGVDGDGTLLNAKPFASVRPEIDVGDQYRRA